MEKIGKENGQNIVSTGFNTTNKVEPLNSINNRMRDILKQVGEGPVLNKDYVHHNAEENSLNGIAGQFDE